MWVSNRLNPVPKVISRRMLNYLCIVPIWLFSGCASVFTRLNPVPRVTSRISQFLSRRWNYIRCCSSQQVCCICKLEPHPGETCISRIDQYHYCFRCGRKTSIERLQFNRCENCAQYCIVCGESHSESSTERECQELLLMIS